jgi:hypothetical protein
MNPTPFPDPLPSPATAASRRRRIAIFLAGAALGGAVGIGIAELFAVDVAARFAGRLAADLWTVLMLPLVWWVCVVVHEFGHLLGGRIGGMRALMLFAGPLHIEFNADGVRVLRNRVTATWGGLAACAPHGERSSGRASFALLVAGGPMASVLLAAATVPAAFAVGGWWGGLLLVTAAMSAGIGVATLIPVRAGGYMSDGGQLLGLAHRDQETRQRLALVALSGQSHAGVRPRDWDPALLRTIGEESGDATLRAVAAMLAANRAEDRGDLEAADANWRAVAAGVGGEQGSSMAPAMRGSFAIGLAAWIGQRRREGGSARRWLDASKGGFAEAAIRAHAEAAVALAEGDTDAARRHRDAARAALPRLSDRGAALALADALDDLAREIAAAISQDVNVVARS